MASSFYYLIGSLPNLQLGEPCPLTGNEFFGMCENFVSPDQLKNLKDLSLVPRDNPCCSVETAWNDFETDLRNWTVRIRSQRSRRDGDTSIRPEGNLVASMELHVTEALDQKTPLDAERMLDELRWQHLQNLSVGHEFDFARLVIYRLQLAIIEKWTHHDASEGLERLQNTVKLLQDSSNPAENGNDPESETI